MMKKLVLAGFVAAALGGGTGAQAMTFGDLFSGRALERSPVVRVQATTPEIQVQQLQDTVRQLTGRIEDLNFQIMQMQEQFRKSQEDNEFRFDQLEKKAGAKKTGALETPAGNANTEAAAAAASQPATTASVDQSAQVQPGGTNPQGQNPSDPVANTISSAAIGDGASSDSLSTANQAAVDPANAQPRSGETANIKPGTLGSLIFGDDGSVVETTRNPADNSADTLPGVDSPPAVTPQKPMEQASTAPDATRAVPSAEESYQSAYKYILGGDYPMAEKGFRDYLAQHPESEKASDASFWLGEAQYSQGHYNDAAKTFLNAYKAYGKSQKAPDILLKLGMSLAALDNKDTACATFREIPKRFPKASRTVMSRVASEQARLSCSTT